MLFSAGRCRRSPFFFLSSTIFFSLLLLCLPHLSTAQSTAGRVEGRVLDQTGAVVPGASLTLTNTNSGVALKAEAGKSGDYIFLAVPVGQYKLQAQAPGFQEAVADGITVQLNATVSYDVHLTVGSTAQSVEVTASAPLVDTTSTQLGAVVDSRSVENLPLNARNTYQLLQLQPGVTGVGGADLFYGSDQAGAVSVNGGRGRSNNFSVNGGDANDQFVNLPTVQPSPDSIQEFRVITNTFDAEYGRNSGSVVNVVTKSGTNQWHGDVYEFFRNKVLNSRGYFDTMKPQFNQNQFGGTFGGPIKKDKTFFFASYEGRRIRQGVPSPVVTVPTAAQRPSATQLFSNFSGLGSPFGGALTNSNVLASRPGCANAIAAEGGSALSDGVAYASIFPNNQIPLPCMDQT